MATGGGDCRAGAADLRVFLLGAGDEIMLDPLADDIVLHPKADIQLLKID